MRFPGNVVTAHDTRALGAGRPDKCFYCSGKTGLEHDPDCVCIERPVKVRLTIDIVMARPRAWTKDQIESHANEGSWCSDNIMVDLERYANSDARCLCEHMTLEYLGDATLEEAIEAGLTPDSEGN